MDLEGAKAFVIARLQESSTWRGLILVATAGFGLNVPPQKVEAIALGGLMLAGLIAVLFPDRRHPPAPPPAAPGPAPGDDGTAADDVR